MDLIGIFILVIPFMIGYFVGKQHGLKQTQKEKEKNKLWKY